ncbi:hypothetical protein JTE90_026370 [Oedothorax gibbosus]|uniref:Gamma-glutamylcyclotransferase family protein n=1 Tax=Oedothorax gibbosus TaxID=931172 RepID=A0AAV6VDG7_9ARAC|nr:hypothetical protein JTE90_026370 [Oedothorax gibbosus]
MTSSFEGGNKSEECEHLIFTYGTLKRGEPNHGIITDSGQATFVGLARTIQKWPMVIASRYNIPYLLYSEGVGKNVIGEVYRVNNIMLSHMDELECHPKYYTRIKAEVEIIRDNINVQQSSSLILRPWIYFLQNFRPHLLDLPHLENYESKGAHGLEYVSSEETCDPEDIYS